MGRGGTGISQDGLHFFVKTGRESRVTPSIPSRDNATGREVPVRSNPDTPLPVLSRPCFRGRAFRPDIILATEKICAPFLFPRDEYFSRVAEV